MEEAATRRGDSDGQPQPQNDQQQSPQQQQQQQRGSRAPLSGKLSSLRRRLWPTCLCSTARDELPDSYTLATASPQTTTTTTASASTTSTPSSAAVPPGNDAAVEQEHIAMASTTTATTTSSSSSSCTVDNDGLVTIRMTGGGPYGFRLSDGGNGQLVVGKLRKRGRADEAGLREGDVLMTVNGRTCQGLSCTQAMDLIDSSGQTLAIRVNRGGTSRVVTTDQSQQQQQQHSSSSVSRSHSVQDRHGQTVYVPSTNPINAPEVFSSSSTTSSTSATVAYTAPLHQPHQPHQPSGSSSLLRPDIISSSSASSNRSSGNVEDRTLTVSAPAGVQVSKDSSTRTFTLTFGLDSGGGGSSSTTVSETTVTRQTATSTNTQQHQQLVWQPPQQQQQQPAVRQQEAPDTAAITRPSLARILQESVDQDQPDTPTSPTARTKKMFIDSAFYDDPEHKYPTVEEQITLARRVAMSVLAPENVNSRGHKMFVRSRERSVRWEAGYKPPESDQADVQPDEKYFRAEPWAVGSGGHQLAMATSPPPADVATPSSANMPLMTFVFGPKLPSGDKVDKERLDALSSEELERVMLNEKKSTHTGINPQVCFNLAEGLRNMKGRGGQLFAKRQAKSESWTVGGGGDTPDTPDQPTPVDEPTATSSAVLELRESTESSTGQPAGRTVSALPVNRLKEMVDVPRAAMTPWEAAVQYGSVDPAFAHLEKTGAGTATGAGSKRESGGSAGSAGSGRVKSWAANNPDAAAGLAAAMTASLQAKTAGDATAKMAPATTSSYQPVKFSVPSAGGTTDL